MESAEQLGFEVRVFARVPDMGDGMDRDRDRGGGDREKGGGRLGYGHKRSVSSGTGGVYGATAAGVGLSSSVGSSGVAAEYPSFKPSRWRTRTGSFNNGNGVGRPKGHSRKLSGSTSTESEQGSGSGGVAGGGKFPNAFMRSLAAGGAALANGAGANGSAVSASLPSTSFNMPGIASPANGPQGTNTPRIRYREQGVDELLQLKLHQVLASIDGPPPPNSTIILATGDGNVGQFNEDGFLGGVRTALKKGWRVELYAWEGGLSKSWKREFGEGSEWGSAGTGKKGKGEDRPRFRVIGMEQFGGELVEVYY